MWVHEITDDPEIEIPESWLQPIEVSDEEAFDLDAGEIAAATARPKASQRRGLFGFLRRRPAEDIDEDTPISEDDDEFMRLIDDDEPVSSGIGIKGQTGPLDPRRGRKPGQTGPLDPRKVRKPGQTGPLDTKKPSVKDDDDLRGLL
jgi:hypothetical protein